MSQIWKDAWCQFGKYFAFFVGGTMLLAIFFAGVFPTFIADYGTFGAILGYGVACFMYVYNIVSYNRSKQLLCRVVELEQKLNLQSHG